MTQAIIQAEIEATKAAIMEVRDVDILVNFARPLHTLCRSDCPVLKLFDWKATDKYQELCYLEIKVKKTFYN